MKVLNFVRSLVFLLVFMMLGVAQAQSVSIHSQRRMPNENYISAARRYVTRMSGYRFVPGQPATALAMAVPLNQLNMSMVTARYSPQDAAKAFKQLRDYRFLVSPERPGFLRRSSWLYPDDGCFARAALASQNLAKWNMPRPVKVFAFGNLNVRTNNAPGGSVSWWYHVVPAVAVNNTVVVFDPAIEPTRPLLLQQWVMKMVLQPDQIKVSICNPTAYVPSSYCQTPSEDEKGAPTDQITYLSYEWQRLVQLNRNPERELGENPPWPADVSQNFQFARPVLQPQQPRW